MKEFNVIYNKTIYRNIKTGYTIFSVSTNSPEYKRTDTGPVPCIAIVPTYASGMPLKIKGDWNVSDKGIYFDAEIVYEHCENEESAIKFLLDGNIKGIADKTAKKIVDVLGTDIFKAIQKQDLVNKIIKEIPSIDEEKATLLANYILDGKIKRDAYQFISNFGGTYIEAIKLVDLYHLKWRSQLLMNPYYIGKQSGLSFYVCDSIAMTNDIDYLNQNRINSLIFESLIQSLNNGHVYLTQKELINQLNKIVKSSACAKPIPTETITSALLHCKFIVIEKDKPCRIYLKSYWTYENESVRHFNRLQNTKVKLPFNDNIASIIEKECHIRYAPAQKKAFDLLKTTGIKIVTGGPGTGKTTTINGIIKAYTMLNPNNKVVLCAPTGRASQRMSESTNRVALTIHKTLDYQCFGNDVSHKDSSNPLDAEFIIVDESSMIDIELFSILLDAIRSGSLICFVGDTNQLPSVGAGRVLNDMIESGKAEVYKLDTVFRQNETSKIIRNCNHILRNESLEEGEDFEIINVDTLDEMSSKIKEITSDLYDEKDPYNMQILGPVKNGHCGIFDINEHIQKLLNHNPVEMYYGKRTYKLNDKVILNKNNYGEGYFNGDLGTITTIESNRIEITTDDKVIELTQRNYEDMQLAYATTIHKAQGSEFPNCIIVLPNRGGNMLNRNLLYTAVSRAKKKVYIINQDNVLEKAISNIKAYKRNTRLKEKILYGIPETIKTTFID